MVDEIAMGGRIHFFDPVTQSNTLDDVLARPDDSMAMERLLQFVKANPNLVHSAASALENLWENNPLSVPRVENLARLYSAVGDTRATPLFELARKMGGSDVLSYVPPNVRTLRVADYTPHEEYLPSLPLWRDGTPYYVFQAR